MELVSISALFGALALFWLSTRQWRWFVRLAIWAAGAALLALAALSSLNEDRFSLVSALGEITGHGSNWRDAALVRAFDLNLETVTPFIGQLFDFFIIAAIAVAVLAALAFTPGEWLERLLRPSIVGLIGFIIGSAATLAVVAIGFGGYVKPRSFAGYVTESDVIDGDSFRIGEHSLRLYGADAPEHDQICQNIEQTNCGEAARLFLANVLAESTVQCEQMLSRRSRRPLDTFGRALVQCWVTPEGQPRTDIAEHLIRNGYAMQYADGIDYGYGDEEREALDSSAGLLAGCVLLPGAWRNNAEARAAFERGQTVPRDLIVGTCE